ncbi:MAG: hypothetical protein M1827_002435 [Pycnora praestabilis]|nr:MAG: hypothetical protein M1827_002435 [Pycnora praestabilis]
MKFQIPFRFSQSESRRKPRIPSLTETPIAAAVKGSVMNRRQIIEIDSSDNEDLEGDATIHVGGGLDSHSATSKPTDPRASTSTGSIEDYRSLQDEDGPNEIEIARRKEQDCLKKVFTVFPDICREHVLQLYKDRPVAKEDHEHLAVDLIEKILESETYPKEKDERKELKRKREESAGTTEEEITEWNAVHEERPASDYKLTARALLHAEFPTVPVKYIDRILKQKGRLYATYFALELAERTYDTCNQPPYKRKKAIRKQRNVPGQASPSAADNTTSQGLVMGRLMDELRAARKKRKKEDGKRQAEADTAAAEAANEREHRETGMMVECQCCFDDLPFNRMTHCDGSDPHFFCIECAKRNANNELGQSRYKVKCMDSSGCQAEFAKEQILRFVDQKTLIALDRLQQQEEIRLADIHDLTRCPFCDFAAICPPVEVDREFRCRNQECEKVSCRLCQQETHIPISCAAYAKENRLSVRHTVEEAMTEALVRSCNQCKNKYIKETGCNKMVCTRCRSIQCYVCSKTISNSEGYSHFNDSNRGGQQGNCPLFDNTEQRHDDEVKKAELTALAKAQAENPDLSEEDLRIQVSDAVKQGEQQRLKQADQQNRLYQPDRHHRFPRPHPPPDPVEHPHAAELDWQRYQQQQAILQQQAMLQQPLPVRAGYVPAPYVPYLVQPPPPLAPIGDGPMFYGGGYEQHHMPQWMPAYPLFPMAPGVPNVLQNPPHNGHGEPQAHPQERADAALLFDFRAAAPQPVNGPLAEALAPGPQQQVLEERRNHRLANMARWGRERVEQARRDRV